VWEVLKRVRVVEQRRAEEKKFTGANEESVVCSPWLLYQDSEVGLTGTE